MFQCLKLMKRNGIGCSRHQLLNFLLNLVIHGEFNGLGVGKHSLELRTVAAVVFEVIKNNCSWISSHRLKHNVEFLWEEEIKLAIVTIFKT